MSHDIEPHVMVPDELGGLAICSLPQLVAYIEEGKPWDVAVEESAIDTVFMRDAVWGTVARVRMLNRNGDAAAYWQLEGKGDPS